MLVDPSDQEVASEEHSGVRADFTFVFDSVARKSVSCHCSGLYSPEEFQEAMMAAREGSLKVFEFYKSSLQKFTKIL